MQVLKASTVRQLVEQGQEDLGELLAACARLGIRVQVQTRVCGCGDDCGYILGEASYGLYLRDEWYFFLERFKWHRDHGTPLSFSQAYAVEKVLVGLVLALEGMLHHGEDGPTMWTPE